jgi:16S rRNA processing protein RimM
MLAKVLRPHGVRGELSLQVLTDFPERIRHLEQVFFGLESDGSGKLNAYTVESARGHRTGVWLIRLEGVEDRDQAEVFRNQYMFVSLAEAVPLEEGEVYLFQVMGITVKTVAGLELGRVTEYIETGANDVYVVQGAAYGEVLIPAIDGVLIKIDTAAGIMWVNPPPGLLPGEDESDESPE